MMRISRRGLNARTSPRHASISVAKGIRGGVTRTVSTKKPTVAGASSTRYAGECTEGKARYSRSSSMPAAEAKRLHRRTAPGPDVHKTTDVPVGSSRTIRFGRRCFAADRRRSMRTAPAGLTVAQLFRHRSLEIMLSPSVQYGERAEPGDRAQDVFVAQDGEGIADSSIVELLDRGRTLMRVAESQGNPSPRIPSG
jgi:hypothetical protein